jgi:TetR/AcrR family transcriptional regulator, tetracycline repressor protein
MPPRAPRLHRHDVVDTALAIVDAEGLQKLTIRTLAQKLGAPPMTLYAHFETKNELLDLTFERLLERLIPPGPAPTWQAELEAICRHMRGVLLKHPHWLPLLTRVTVPVCAMDVYHRLLSLMAKDGFRPEAAMFAFSSAMSLAIGSVLVERMMGHPPVPVRRLTLMKAMVAEMPRGRYPHIASAATKFDQWSFDNVFELELRSLVAGLADECGRPRAADPGARSLA